MNYTHEIVGTHWGALLPESVPLEHAPAAKSLSCIGLQCYRYILESVIYSLNLGIVLIRVAFRKMVFAV